MVIDYNLRAPAAQQAGTPSAASKTSTSGDNAFSDLFIKLLASQLKSQSPLDPVDPSQFVGQLVQLNSLNELTQIRQLLSGTTPKSAAPATQRYSTSTNSILSPAQLSPTQGA